MPLHLPGLDETDLARPNGRRGFNPTLAPPGQRLDVETPSSRQRSRRRPVARHRHPSGRQGPLCQRTLSLRKLARNGEPGHSRDHPCQSAEGTSITNPFPLRKPSGRNLGDSARDRSIDPKAISDPKHFVPESTKPFRVGLRGRSRCDGRPGETGRAIHKVVTDDLIPQFGLARRRRGVKVGARDRRNRLGANGFR